MSFSGRTAASKTANEGSIPSTPAVQATQIGQLVFFRARLKEGPNTVNILIGVRIPGSELNTVCNALC